jgi:hypothetical protein
MAAVYASDSTALAALGKRVQAPLII